VSRWTKIVLPLSLVAVLSLGCGLCGQLPQLPPSGDTNNGQTESATAVAPGETNTGGEETSSENNDASEESDIPSVSAGLDALDSYVAHFKMTVKDSENDQEALSYEMRIESVRDPVAQRIELSSDDPSEAS